MEEEIGSADAPPRANHHEASAKPRLDLGPHEEWLAFAVLYVCSILITGYQVYVDNHALQLPIVQRLVDSTLYPGDPFMETAPFYASLLWGGIARAAPVVPPMVQLALLFLVERGFALMSFRALARALAPGSRVAAISAMALAALAPLPIIADGTIIPGYLEQTGLAVPLFVLSIASFIRGRPLACALYLGLGFDLTSLYGAYALTYLGMMALADRTWRADWKRWCVAAALFAVVASPAIVLSAQAYGRGETNTALWLWASRVRFSHHLYPWTWSKAGLIHFGLMLGLVIAVAWTQRSRLGRVSALALAWCATAGFWFIVACLAPLLASPALLTAHPGRGCDLWQVFASVFLVCLAAREVEAPRAPRLLGEAALIAAMLVWFKPHGKLVWVWIVVAGWVRARNAGVFPARVLPLRAVIVGLVIMVALSVSAKRVIKRHALEDVLGARPNAQVVELAVWAERYTPRDAVFLIDPFWPEFRPLARRPVFTTWKDGAAILWDRPFVSEWTERMRALELVPYADVSAKEARARVASGYERLTDADVRALDGRFGIDFWIVAKDRSSSFPTASTTEQFKVLAVR